MVHSDDIRLRAVEPLDADFMYEIENDPTCWRYGETVAPISRRILRDYALTYDADPFAARQLRLIIEDQSTHSQTGVIDLYEIDPVNRRAFIGIYILPSWRDKGIATQAISLLETYSFNVLRLRMLAARIESVNKVSLSLFKKAGFTQRAVIPEWFLLPSGATSDLIIFTKFLNEEERSSN